jgi:mRNA-degrading endonuclease RelE of RelBE toxin-antitoxin system
MKVLIHKRVIKFLNKLDERRKLKILEVLRLLEKFPLVRADIRKIGEKTFRLRIGDLRVIFDYTKDTIFVKHIDFRGRVYKKK